MRIRILSDVHLDIAPFSPPAVDADVVVLAGDTGAGCNGVLWAREAFPGTPVIYVTGNHEYYGKATPHELNKMRQAAKGCNVRVLENEAVRIGGFTFFGCTLWTDLDLLGDQAEAARQAALGMNDYLAIRVSPTFRRLCPNDTLAFHSYSREWLRREFAKPRDGARVVVTHHAPSIRSIPEEFRQEVLSAAYASSLDDLVAASGAALWVHGHFHTPADYCIGNTRVLSNPRGYHPRQAGNGFVEDLVVEV